MNENAKSIKWRATPSRPNICVIQLEQYRQTEEGEERDSGPSSVEADKLGVEIKQEISYPDVEATDLSKAVFFIIIKYLSVTPIKELGLPIMFLGLELRRLAPE